jgi:crossover junction endodeoxyribonuclease RusA
MILDLTVPGDPIPKARPRSGANHVTYTPKRTRDAEKVIATLARAQLGPVEPVDVPVGISVVFHCATRRRTDGDNLLKLVTDALNQIAYTDDYLIEVFEVRVIRGIGPSGARTQITVWRLEV